MFGFALAAVLLLLLKSDRPRAGALRGAQRRQPPPLVDPRHADPDLHAGQFFHGSNDGQKGMGLIMLILIGTVPTAYALNRAMPESQMQLFAQPRKARKCGDKSKGGRI